MSKDKHKKSSHKHHSKKSSHKAKIKGTDKEGKKAQLLATQSQSDSQDSLVAPQDSKEKASLASKVLLGGILALFVVGTGVSWYLGHMVMAMTLGLFALAVPAALVLTSPSKSLTSPSQGLQEGGSTQEELTSKLTHMLVNNEKRVEATAAQSTMAFSQKSDKSASLEEDEALSESSDLEEDSEQESEDSFEMSRENTKRADPKDFEKLTTNPSYKNLLKFM